MRASEMNGRAIGAAFPSCWIFVQNVNSKPRNILDAVLRSRGRLTPWFFYISLWLSSLLAIWMSRGWIALFLSGQVFSAGNWLLKNLARKTLPAFSPSAESTEPVRRSLR